MNGIFGAYGTGTLPPAMPAEAADLITGTLQAGRVVLGRASLPKFLSDKLCTEQDGLLIVTDGVVLNDEELFRQFHADNLADLVVKLYRQKGTGFFHLFRGFFCGAVYDIRADRLIVYTDHAGGRHVFYSVQEGGLRFGCDIAALAKSLDSIRPDRRFCYSMLSYGFSPLHLTAVEDIRMIPAGHYLDVHEGNVELKRYHRLVNRPNRLSEEDNVEQLDRLFRQAVRRFVSKNERNGFDHYLSLSAGLDLRMATWVTTEMARRKVFNYTYSQSGFHDETTAKTIAAHLGNPHLFEPLDGGDYLLRIDQSWQLSGGITNYPSPAQAYAGLRLLPADRLGLIGSGMAGDIILGDCAYNRRRQLPPYKAGDGALNINAQALYPKFLPEGFESLRPLHLLHLHTRLLLCQFGHTAHVSEFRRTLHTLLRHRFSGIRLHHPDWPALGLPPLRPLDSQEVSRRGPLAAQRITHHRTQQPHR